LGKRAWDEGDNEERTCLEGLAQVERAGSDIQRARAAV